MTTAVSVYKGQILLGTATATATSATLASYSGAVVHQGRNVLVTATAGNDTGKTFKSRVVTDNLTSLVLANTFDLA